MDPSTLIRIFRVPHDECWGAENILGLGCGIAHSEEIFDLALEEYLEDGNLIIEWPEIGEKYLPKPDLEIMLEHTDLNSQRKIIIKTNTKESLEKLL